MNIDPLVFLQREHLRAFDLQKMLFFFPNLLLVNDGTRDSPPLIPIRALLRLCADDILGRALLRDGPGTAGGRRKSNVESC